MMEFRFVITREKIEELNSVEFEALERAMDGEFKMYRVRPTAARFMVDENDKPLPYSVALKRSEALKVKDYAPFLETFFGSMRDGAVPKENGNGSKSPTVVEPQDSPSPDGSAT